MKPYIIRTSSNTYILSELFERFKDRLSECSYCDQVYTHNDDNAIEPILYFKVPITEDEKLYLILKYNFKFYADDDQKISTQYFSPCVINFA